MSPKTKRALKGLLFMSMFSFASSQSFGENALSLADCIKEASVNNRDLLAAQRTLNAADAGRTASFGQFFPQLSFNSSISRSGDGGFNDALTGPAYDQNARVSLTAQENLFSGLKDFAAVDQAGANLDIARAQLTQAKAQLSHDLKVDFHQLLFTQKQIVLLSAIADRQKSNLDLVQMNFKGGTDNKGSFYQAQAAYEQAKYEVGQAQRALRVAQRQLAQDLGRPGLDPITVRGEFTTPKLPGGLPDFPGLTLRTPAHLQAVARLSLSDSSYVSARSAFFPTLSANASLSRAGENFDNTQPGWSAGLELSFPLFTGGRDFFNLRSAEESKLGAKDSLESADLRTESLLESGYAAYQDAVEQVAIQAAFMQAAKTQAEIAKAQYLHGLLIFQNWNQIEENLTNQQKAQLSSLLNVETTEAGWELAQGKGVIP